MNYLWIIFDHILLHCGKVRLLWELLFSLFRVCWVIHSTVQKALLRWHGLFIGRKCGEQRLYASSRQFGKREIEDLLRMWNFLFKG